MAIAPIHPAPPLAAADAVRQVHTVLDRCAPVDDLDGYAASRLLGDVQRARTRLEAMELSLVATVDKSPVAADAGMTGTAAWLAARSRRDGASAAREVSPTQSRNTILRQVRGQVSYSMTTMQNSLRQLLTALWRCGLTRSHGGV